MKESIWNRSLKTNFIPCKFFITIMSPTKEKDIIPAARSLPTIKSLCPADNVTRRSYVKSLLKNICRDVPIAKDRIIGAVTHPERNNLWQDKSREN